SIIHKSYRGFRPSVSGSVAMGTPAMEGAAAGATRAVLEPVAAIGRPPGDRHDWKGGRHRPPQRQEEVREQSQYNEDEPEHFALHPAIVWDSALALIKLPF